MSGRRRGRDARAAAASAHAQDIVMVPVTVDGERVRLAMRIYKTPRPAPTLVFNHGSTGGGSNPARRALRAARLGRRDARASRAWRIRRRVRRRLRSRSIARLQRRASRAAGSSASSYAAKHPEQVKAVINFSGGWHGMGRTHGREFNEALFARGARYPHETLWLYGARDWLYDSAHSGNFTAFQAAGGKGTFVEIPDPAASMGHRVVEHPAAWAADVTAYLKRRGL